MVDPEDFRRTIRRGARAGNAMVVVHCRTDEDSRGALVGFVVPKREIPRATGRNRVKRQLRHLMRSRLDAIPHDARVVVRVNGQALGHPARELGERLDDAMGRAWRKWDRR